MVLVIMLMTININDLDLVNCLINEKSHENILICDAA